MARPPFAFLFAAGAVAASIGCSRPASRVPSLHRAALYRRLEGEPGTLNPILQTSETEESVLANVTRNLIDVDRGLQPIGGLCDRWESTDDRRTFVFHLRPEACWEDGAPVTSRDAVFTLRRVTDPRVPAPALSPGFESFLAADEVDARTFRVKFSKSYAFRLLAFHLPLLPARRYENRDLLAAPENRAPVSNGPYRFRRWKSGEEIELVRNERYWGKPAPFDRMIFRILPDQTQAYRALVRGELDEARLGAEQSARAESDPQFSECCRLLRFYDLSITYLGYNNRLACFRDPATRKALTMLLDRQAIVDRIYRGAGRVLSGPWPADIPEYDPAILPYPFDPVQARGLLERAGWRPAADGLTRDGAVFRFDLLYYAKSNSSREVAELAREAFQRVGIDCRPAATEWAVLTKRMDAGDFDAVVASWASDVNPDLYATWHSSQSAPIGMNNLSYRSSTADRLIELIRTETDDRSRLALFHRLHAALHDDEPATWLFQAEERHAVSRRLNGVEASPAGLFRFWPGSAAWSTDPGSGPPIEETRAPDRRE